MVGSDSARETQRGELVHFVPTLDYLRVLYPAPLSYQSRLTLPAEQLKFITASNLSETRIIYIEIL